MSWKVFRWIWFYGNSIKFWSNDSNQVASIRVEISDYLLIRWPAYTSRKELTLSTKLAWQHSWQLGNVLKATQSKAENSLDTPANASLHSICVHLIYPWGEGVCSHVGKGGGGRGWSLLAQPYMSTHLPLSSSNPNMARQNWELGTLKFSNS